ncbi:MAG: type II toxin-antitoxin system HicA family toxin [Dehalococcoidia bacterium]|nr:type II toxin-antitoxin system HicA family toxin [Dehalococcoidia bacterium]
MTARLPRVTAARAARALERAGFIKVRQSGSHMICKNPQGKRTTIPYHSGKVLHPKVLLSILRDVGLTVEEFIALMG